MKTCKRQPRHRRALIGVALAGLALLGACATRPATENRVEPERYYVGWVRFAGEFTLYSDRSALEESQTAHCLSGALPLEKQKTAAQQFNGKRVLVRAKAVRWSLPDREALTLKHEGSPITNWCGGKVVLFASQMMLEQRQFPDR